jgi:hypothetical protein
MKKNETTTQQANVSPQPPHELRQQGQNHDPPKRLFAKVAFSVMSNPPKKNKAQFKEENPCNQTPFIGTFPRFHNQGSA